MTADPAEIASRGRRPLRPVLLILGGLALFGAGVLVNSFIDVGGRRTPEPAPATGMTDSTTARPPAPTASGAPTEVTVRVPEDLAARAGVELATAERKVVTARLRLPASVQPNAYQRVVVSPLVSGRVTSVAVELGDLVQRGAPLARIFSSELGDAHAKYAAVSAELQAADRRAARTARLVEIGAASRQELEADQAQQARLAAEAQGAGARLRELGLPLERLAATAPTSESASIVVPAPITGVITDRTANVGLVVQPSSELFTVAAISPVWVIADIHESDLSKVRVGSAATVETDGPVPRTIAGKVAYIAPDVRPETRTAQLRVEVPNPSGALRFGTFVTVNILTPGTASVVAVPAAAVQSIGGRHYVYVSPAGRPGEYVEREVAISDQDGETVAILSGVEAGERVVAKGSFLVRAERERLGLRPSSAPAPAGPVKAPSATPEVVKVVVTETGFEPNRIKARQGSSVTLEFTRRTDKTCGTEIVVPSQQIRAALPLNVPIRVSIRVGESGEVPFLCGMNMLKGVIVAGEPLGSS